MVKRILIIDDEQEIVSVLSVRLKSLGFEVFCAYDGAAGLDLAQREVPDLMILDIMLPHINGFSVLSLLKGNEKYKAIPVMILTAREGENDRVFDQDFKPEAFLTKPFNTEDLVQTVYSLIGEPHEV